MPSDGQANDSPKWWIDQSKAGEGSKRRGSDAPYGARFYRSAAGYEQERARSNLTDLNKKLLMEGDPPEGGFAILRLIDEQAPSQWIENAKRTLRLPPEGRALLVDSGRSVRAIVTGTPPGERILEFNFNKAQPSFDAWVRDEWREEIVFRSLGEMRRRAPELIERYLGAAALAERELFV